MVPVPGPGAHIHNTSFRDQQDHRFTQFRGATTRRSRSPQWGEPCSHHYAYRRRGGPNNQPLARAFGQMMIDGLREPLGFARIASRDYLRFGLIESISLFRAMTSDPTIDRLAAVERPMLVVLGRRDPLVDEQLIRCRLTLTFRYPAFRYPAFRYPALRVSCLSVALRGTAEDDDATAH